MQCVLVTFFAPTAPSPSTPTLSTLTSMSTQLLVFILFFFLIQRLQFMLPNYFREGGLSTWGRILQRNTLFQQMSVVSSSSVRDSVLCISSPCWDFFFFLVWALAGPVHTVIFTVSLCVWLPYSVWKILCAWAISGSCNSSASLPGRRFLSLE